MMFTDKKLWAEFLDVEVVCFDAADTLMYIPHCIGEVYANHAQRFDLYYSPQLLDRAFRDVWSTRSNCSKGEQHPGRDKNWWLQLAHQIFQAVDPKLIDLPDELMEELYSAFSNSTRWTLYSDVETCLQLLTGQGLRLAVLSNFDERLLNVLEELKISHFFEEIFHSAMLGCSKPDSRAFLAVCSSLNVEPNRVVYVGDSITNDYEGARNAGLQAVWLNRTSSAARSAEFSINECYWVNSLKEFSSEFCSRRIKL